MSNTLPYENAIENNLSVIETQILNNHVIFKEN